MNKFKMSIICVLAVFMSTTCFSQTKEFVEISRFHAPEARQGVAVDENYIYVISNRDIGKYDKKTHQLVKSWHGEDGGPIIHLDSGVIIDGKLYCAHSNYPGVPMTSSVEIWDAETLKHIDSHSFGIHWGSCTWVDRHDGFWWAAFAQYEKLKDQTGKGTEWTTLVKFDNNWRFLGAWVYPDSLIQKFRPMSNSGGAWGPDGLLYCTGHDYYELYVLKIPEKGSVLEWVETLQISSYGQGIAWDKSAAGVIYGIRKKERQVVVSKLVTRQN